jgi:hypothetical protein
MNKKLNFHRLREKHAGHASILMSSGETSAYIAHSQGFGQGLTVKF